MKQIGVVLTILAVFGVCAAASAQRVKLRNPSPPAHVVDEPGENEEETRREETEDAERDDEELEDVDDSDELLTVDEPEEEQRPETEESTVTPTALGALIPPPDRPRANAQKTERPVAPDAMRMTLEELAPTKLLRSPDVLRAVARTPRADFLPKKRRDYAYTNSEVPLEGGRALETPFNDAFLCEAIAPESSDRVLVVERGVGYCAAILSELVDEVYLVGIDKTQTRAAVPAIKALKYQNLYVRLGELTTGWSDRAPYDKIVVVGGVEEVPEELIAQLKDGGKLVAPIGDAICQTITLCEKQGEKLEFRPLLTVSMDMLTPESKSKVGAPLQLLGGDFEELTETPYEAPDAPTLEPRANASIVRFATRRPTPVGWCDGRLFEVVEGDAYDGARACVFDNVTTRDEQIKKEKKDERLQAATLPEERKNLTEYGQAIKERQLNTELISQLRQRTSLDGASVKRAVFSGAFRVDALTSGATLARVVFYDKDRRELETRDILRAASVTREWREFSEEIQVPFRAKSADVVIGVLDGVGVVRFDALQLRNKADRSVAPRR